MENRGITRASLFALPRPLRDCIDIRRPLAGSRAGFVIAARTADCVGRRFHAPVITNRRRKNIATVKKSYFFEFRPSRWQDLIFDLILAQLFHLLPDRSPVPLHVGKRIRSADAAQHKADSKK